MATLSSTTLVSNGADSKIHDKTNEWQWPDTASLLNFSKDAISPQEAVIAWGIAESGSASGDGISIDVLCLMGTNAEWHLNVDDDELGRVMQRTHGNSDERILRVCFIDTLNAVGGDLPGNFSFRPSTIHCLQEAGLSPLLLSNIYTESSHWAKMGNQRLVHKDEERNLVCFELCYQYRYGWIDPMSISYIHMMREQHGSTYFCINYPTRARSTLMARLNKAPESVHQDFLIDYLAADGSLSQWQLDIGSKRKILIEKEKTYKAMTMKAGFDKETRDLHGMSREWLALREDLVAFDAQLGFLRDAHNMLVDIKPKTTKWNVAGIHEACNPFDVLVSQAGICSRWTLVYRDRTDICIQMLFHLSNQRIATSSQQIAHQTQKDSASMITLAAVTMIFLPGTFISAILSTTMFDYGHDGVQVSQQWWILLITTFLLTGLVFGAWYRWQYVWVPGHVEARKVGDVEE